MDNREKKDPDSQLTHAKLSPAKQALLEKWMHGKSPSFLQNTHAPIERVTRDQELPLSFLVESVLIKAWTQPGFRGDGVMSRGGRLKGTFDEAAMTKAFDALACRHEILRTTFPFVEGKVIQVISSTPTVMIPVFDLSGIDHNERESQLQHILADEIERPYDLSNDVLWRAMVVRLGEDDRVVLLT